MAGEVLLEISKDEDERAKLRSRKKYEMDMTSNRIERDARVKKEGKKEANKDTAQIMLDDNEPIEKIIRYTGLTMDDIKKLQK